MINNLLKSILKTAVYFLDQSDRLASDVRDRVSDSLDDASDRVSELRDQAHYLYDDHTMRNVITFAAGVAVGVGAGILFAPASGQEIRGSIGDKVHDIGDRMRDRFAAESKSATGTEGR